MCALCCCVGSIMIFLGKPMLFDSYAYSTPYMSGSGVSSLLETNHGSQRVE